MWGLRKTNQMCGKPIVMGINSTDVTNIEELVTHRDWKRHYSRSAPRCYGCRGFGHTVESIMQSRSRDQSLGMFCVWSHQNRQCHWHFTSTIWIHIGGLTAQRVSDEEWALKRYIGMRSVHVYNPRISYPKSCWCLDICAFTAQNSALWRMFSWDTLNRRPVPMEALDLIPSELAVPLPEVSSTRDPGHQQPQAHDDVIKWKHFPRHWPFVRGIHRSPVNSPHKGQWRGALMFSLISVWIKGWVNNREAGDLRRQRGHYDVIIMCIWSHPSWRCHYRRSALRGIQVISNPRL